VYFRFLLYIVAIWMINVRVCGAPDAAANWGHGCGLWLGEVGGRGGGFFCGAISAFQVQ